MNKILYVHRTQGRAVESVHILGITHGFEKLGYTVDFLSPAGGERPGSDSSKSNKQPAKMNALSWLSANIPEIVFELGELFYNIYAYVLGRKYLKRGGYSFIYERYAIFSIVGLLFSRKLKCPLVLEINYTSRSPLVRSRSRFFQPLATKVDNWLFNKADAFAVVSSELKLELINEFGVNENRISVIPNACDPARFCPKEWKRKNGSICNIGFIGGFYPWHGVSLLLDAAHLMIKEGMKVHFLLVGDGPELDGICSKINSLGIERFFTLTGRIAHMDIPEYLDKFDIGVMPDSNMYGSPMKLFEYMAASIPYVAADYPPIVEITNGQGVLFKKNTAKSLRNALEKLVRDAELRKQLGMRGRYFVEQKYNWIQNSKMTLDLIKRVR